MSMFTALPPWLSRQGVMTTPTCYIAYRSIKFHFYADDTQLYIQLSPKTAMSSLVELQQCLGEIQAWMGSNKLKLNPDKTEFILFGSNVQRSELSKCFPVDILGNQLTPSDKVRNLGVFFDKNFTFSEHVSSIRKSCFVHLRDLRWIRRFLPKPVAIVLANALVSSRLDYCNSLFRSLSCNNLHRLQCIQNSLARIVTNTNKFCHITPILKSLHWLPIKYRIIFKTCTLVFKYINTGLPKYFDSCLSFYNCSVNTRRSNPKNRFLVEEVYTPKIHKSKKHFNNSFCIDGPSLWNSLPLGLRSTPTLHSFRRSLKSYLFQKAFPP